ncbi:hypothetical protein HAX54_027385, partial [Datura stramonium]|nr:hypothetical protein [Datura stramonium]
IQAISKYPVSYSLRGEFRGTRPYLILVLHNVRSLCRIAPGKCNLTAISLRGPPGPAHGYLYRRPRLSRELRGLQELRASR